MRRFDKRRGNLTRWAAGGAVVMVAAGLIYWRYGGKDAGEAPARDELEGIVAGSHSTRAPADNAAPPAGPAAAQKPTPASPYKLAASEEPLRPASAPATPTTAPATTRPALRPATTYPAATQPVPTTMPADPYVIPPDPTAGRARDDTRSGNVVIESARRLVEGGKYVEARDSLSVLVRRGGLAPAEDREARALLTRVADETIFGKSTAPNDPLVTTYTIQSGDVLVNIGKKHGVPAEALMLINGITDARRIRVDQKIKIPTQPFHARIYKSQFRMDIYLGDTYVRSYRVGLGAENGTPEGVWRVKERLANPTYFPSESSPHKRVIPADDPNNPLGEWWIGLEGVEGAAVGHSGYGIHGTIEPESIGKAVSLGCVRMHNEDVGFVWKLLQPGKSTVTILP